MKKKTKWAFGLMFLSFWLMTVYFTLSSHNRNIIIGDSIVLDKTNTACKSKRWLKKFPKTAQECLELIRQEGPTKCNQKVFNYADEGGDNNCGCVMDLKGCELRSEETVNTYKLGNGAVGVWFGRGETSRKKTKLPISWKRCIPVKNPADLPRVLVVVHSGATRDAKTRQRQRMACKPMYDCRTNVDMKFSIGIATTKERLPKTHNQGVKANAEELKHTNALLTESKEFGDLLFAPMRDMYVDITLKMLDYYRWGVEQKKYDYILKADDEYCFNMTVFDKLVRERNVTNSKKRNSSNSSSSAVRKYRGRNEKGRREIYFGNHHWKTGEEYTIMKGPDGQAAPFFSGATMGLSIDLLKTIMVDDWDHTVNFQMYGTSSDDANVGKWVKHAKVTHELAIDLVEHKKLRLTIPESAQVDNLPW